MRTELPQPGNQSERRRSADPSERTLHESARLNESFYTTQQDLIKLYVSRNLTESRLPLRQFMKEFEKQILESMLFLTGGNQKKAAHLLGMKETTFSQKLRKYRIFR